MKSRILLAAAVAALVATGAQAEGWHASILGGPTWTPHLSVGGGSATTDTGFNAGGRLGYDLNDCGLPSGFSLDTDLFYTQSSFNTFPSSRVSSLSFMENLTYKMDTGMGFGVYGGGGIGAVRTMLTTPTIDDGSTVLGWQALGGVEFPFTPNTTMFAEYRYLNAHDVNIGGVTGIGNTSNNVSVGIKFNL